MAASRSHAPPPCTCAAVGGAGAVTGPSCPAGLGSSLDIVPFMTLFLPSPHSLLAMAYIRPENTGLGAGRRYCRHGHCLGYGGHSSCHHACLGSDTQKNNCQRGEVAQLISTVPRREVPPCSLILFSFSPPYCLAENCLQEEAQRNINNQEGWSWGACDSSPLMPQMET